MCLVKFHTHYINYIFHFLLDYTNDATLQLSGLRQAVVKTQDSHIERDFHLSLDDLFHGCTKKIKISRMVIAAVPHFHSF